MNREKRKVKGLAICAAPLALCVFHLAFLSPPAEGGPGGDVTLVKKVISARRDYQLGLEQLRTNYEAAGDAERLRWAEEELRAFHRVPKWAYVIDLDVAGPGLKPDQNVPSANE